MRTCHQTALAFLAFAMTGCDDTNDKDGGEIGPVIADCGDDISCDLTLHLDSNDVQDCFGPYDFQASPPEDGWPPGTPVKIVNYCSPPPVSGECLIPLQEQTGIDAIANPACICVPGLDGMDPPGPECCNYDTTCWSPILPDLLTCDPNAHYYCNKDCTSPVGWTPNEDCEDTGSIFGFPVAPDANFKLYVDRWESFIYIQTPTDSQTFFVHGGGSLSTVTDEFLTATIYASDGELGGIDWTDWWFWTSAPISYDQSGGTFTVSGASSMSFDGAGLANDSPKVFEINGMSEDMDGHIYPLSHTWEADFSQTSLGWTVTLHLEGPFEGL